MDSEVSRLKGKPFLESKKHPTETIYQRFDLPICLIILPPRNRSTQENGKVSPICTHMQSCTHIKLMHIKHNTLYVHTKMLQHNQKKFLCIDHMFIYLKRPASSF
jgi:hypothetical protein